MLIAIAGNETSVTLDRVKSNWVFALSANTLNASTGLSSGWLCKYHFHALPDKPKLIDPMAVDTSDNTINVRWFPLTCDISSNNAKVVMYIVQLRNVLSG